MLFTASTVNGFKGNAAPTQEDVRNALESTLEGEWQMIIAEEAGTPTYVIKLFFNRVAAGWAARQVITAGDVRPFRDINIDTFQSAINGQWFARVRFIRTMDGHSYQAVFSYGHMLIGTHGACGNWHALKLPQGPSE